ncbi:DUF6635 family protein [Loktanella salsilacus]|uniref:DUF6635 family protein n=1 Tax=Loktanella salsilacus TaxID=195913 RepID=UPI0037363BE6
MPPAPDQNAAAVRAAIDTFVRDHFHLGATLRLHRSALGWDLLRAPVNVALAPIHLVMALFALAARLIGFRRFGAWLMARRVMLRTSVAQRIEADIATDLLQGAPLTPRSQALIDNYTSVRSAVAEITTSLIVLTTGWLIFGTATPGIASLTPKVSGYVGHATAVTNFPLGQTLGGAWYGVFPVSLPVWTVIAIGVALAMTASIVTTFAGIIADPVQAHLGIHRRRLTRLLFKIALAEGDAPGLAPEHILARISDIADAGMSLLRVFRS